MKRVFVSYARRDREFCEQLGQHLTGLQKDGKIATWHDGDIAPGDDWRAAIERELASADILIVLVSASFLASNACQDLELRHALERSKAGAVQIVPVLVRACAWESSRIQSLQMLPDGAKPVEEWPKPDSAWVQVARHVERLATAPSASPSASSKRRSPLAKATEASSAFSRLLTRTRQWLGSRGSIETPGADPSPEHAVPHARLDSPQIDLSTQPIDHRGASWVTSDQSAPAPRHAAIVIQSIRDCNELTSHLISPGATLIGGGQSCQIRLNDHQLSGHDLLIESSTSFVWTASRPGGGGDGCIEMARVALKSGTVLSMGSYRLVFLCASTENELDALIDRELHWLQSREAMTGLYHSRGLSDIITGGLPDGRLAQNGSLALLLLLAPTQPELAEPDMCAKAFARELWRLSKAQEVAIGCLDWNKFAIWLFDSDEQSALTLLRTTLLVAGERPDGTARSPSFELGIGIAFGREGALATDLVMAAHRTLPRADKWETTAMRHAPRVDDPTIPLPETSKSLTDSQPAVDELSQPDYAEAWLTLQKYTAPGPSSLKIALSAAACFTLGILGAILGIPLTIVFLLRAMLGSGRLGKRNARALSAVLMGFGGVFAVTASASAQWLERPRLTGSLVGDVGLSFVAWWVAIGAVGAESYSEEQWFPRLQDRPTLSPLITGMVGAAYTGLLGWFLFSNVLGTAVLASVPMIFVLILHRILS